MMVVDVDARWPGHTRDDSCATARSLRVQMRQPQDGGSRANPDHHQQRQDAKRRGHDELTARITALLRVEIPLQDTKWQQVLRETQKAQEGSDERFRIEADRPLVHHDPEHQADAEKPDAAHGQQEAQGPATMQIEPLRPGMTPGNAGEAEYQQRIEADPQMLRQVADHAAAQPHHGQAAHAEDRGGKQVGSTVPAMKRGRTAANSGNQLQHSADEDSHDKQQVQRKHEIEKRRAAT